MRDHEYNMQDYQQTYSSFQWEHPEKYNFARDVIDRWDPTMPTMLWVDDGGAEITRTFGEIGEVVKAFVALAPGHAASADLKQELQDHVKRVTAPYKYPRRIDFIDALPKTVSGKIRRIELREGEWRN